MKVTIVDEQDNILGYKERDDRDQPDIIRVSGLWIFNSKKEALIAQRGLHKVNAPGKWGPSVAGTVEEGETYITNIIKEAYEELRIVLSEKDLILGSHRFYSTSHKYFCQSYFTKLDFPILDFIIPKDEVEQIRWVPVKELSEWLLQKPDEFIVSFEPHFDDLQEFLQKK